MKYKTYILFLSMTVGTYMYAGNVTSQPTSNPENKNTDVASAIPESVNVTVNVIGNGKATNQTSSKSSAISSNISEQSVKKNDESIGLIAWLLRGWTIEVCSGTSSASIKT
ncbi:MAG TPA: hypothetical protein VLG50_00930 [Candidatus Saccharimonadales bacterium]|nr:hypothetical protein [Candidatus Saccharimonadales bacterium]